MSKSHTSFLPQCAHLYNGDNDADGIGTALPDLLRKEMRSSPNSQATISCIQDPALEIDQRGSFDAAEL